VTCPVCNETTQHPCDRVSVADLLQCKHWRVEKDRIRDEGPGPIIPQRQPFNEAPKAPALDTQIGGSHYKDMPIQPMTYSMVNGLDACQHTIIKYVSRFREKGGIEDLEKAIHCTELLIEFEREKLQK
jgi:hypothetical protein